MSETTTKPPAKRSTRKPAPAATETAAAAAPKAPAKHTVTKPTAAAAKSAPAAAAARKAPAKRAATKAAAPVEHPTISAEERNRMIAVAAYYRAEQRGFEEGYEVSDWLAAEADIERLLGKPA